MKSDEIWEVPFICHFCWLFKKELRLRDFTIADFEQGLAHPVHSRTLAEVATRLVLWTGKCITTQVKGEFDPYAIWEPRLGHQIRSWYLERARIQAWVFLVDEGDQDQMMSGNWEENNEEESSEIAVESGSRANLNVLRRKRWGRPPSDFNVEDAETRIEVLDALLRPLGSVPPFGVPLRDIEVLDASPNAPPINFDVVSSENSESAKNNEQFTSAAGKTFADLTIVERARCLYSLCEYYLHMQESTSELMRAYEPCDLRTAIGRDGNGNVYYHFQGFWKEFRIYRFCPPSPTEKSESEFECEGVGCGFDGTREEVEEHEKNCPFLGMTFTIEALQGKYKNLYGRYPRGRFSGDRAWLLNKINASERGSPLPSQEEDDDTSIDDTCEAIREVRELLRSQRSPSNIYDVNVRWELCASGIEAVEKFVSTLKKSLKARKKKRTKKNSASIEAEEELLDELKLLLEEKEEARAEIERMKRKEERRRELELMPRKRSSRVAKKARMREEAAKVTLDALRLAEARSLQDEERLREERDKQRRMRQEEMRERERLLQEENARAAKEREIARQVERRERARIREERKAKFEGEKARLLELLDAERAKAEKRMKEERMLRVEIRQWRLDREREGLPHDDAHLPERLRLLRDAISLRSANAKRSKVEEYEEQLANLEKARTYKDEVKTSSKNRKNGKNGKKMEDPDCRNLKRKLTKAEAKLRNCAAVYSELRKMENADIFMEPVTEEMAPGYFDLIKEPRDLGLVFRKLKKKKRSEQNGKDGNGETVDLPYASHLKFAEDIRLVFKNCKTFNADGSAIWKLAHRMLKVFERRFDDWVLGPFRQNSFGYGAEFLYGDPSKKGGGESAFWKKALKSGFRRDGTSIGSKDKKRFGKVKVKKKVVELISCLERLDWEADTSGIAKARATLTAARRVKREEAKKVQKLARVDRVADDVVQGENTKKRKLDEEIAEQMVMPPKKNFRVDNSQFCSPLMDQGRQILINQGQEFVQQTIAQPNFNIYKTAEKQ